MIYKQQEKCGKRSYDHNTIFCDFDGICVEHRYPPFIEKEVFLSSSILILRELQKHHNYIVLTTGRKKEDCKKALRQLKKEWNFEFDNFVFGLPVGKRIVINDMKPDGRLTAFSCNYIRNLGLNVDKLKEYGFWK